MLGIKLKANRGKGSHSASATLDRLIPRLGYVPGNIAVISDRANRIKSDATVEEITAVADWLRKVLKTKRNAKTASVRR